MSLVLVEVRVDVGGPVSPGLPGVSEDGVVVDDADVWTVADHVQLAGYPLWGKGCGLAIHVTFPHPQTLTVRLTTPHSGLTSRLPTAPATPTAPTQAGASDWFERVAWNVGLAVVTPDRRRSS